MSALRRVRERPGHRARGAQGRRRGRRADRDARLLAHRPRDRAPRRGPALRPAHDAVSHGRDLRGLSPLAGHDPQHPPDALDGRAREGGGGDRRRARDGRNAVRRRHAVPAHRRSRRAPALLRLRHRRDHDVPLVRVHARAAVPARRLRRPPLQRPLPRPRRQRDHGRDARPQPRASPGPDRLEPAPSGDVPRRHPRGRRPRREARPRRDPGDPPARPCSRSSSASSSRGSRSTTTTCP